MHAPGFIKSPFLPFYSLYDLPDVIYPVKIYFLLYMNCITTTFVCCEFVISISSVEWCGSKVLQLLFYKPHNFIHKLWRFNFCVVYVSCWNVLHYLIILMFVDHGVLYLYTATNKWDIHFKCMWVFLHANWK